MQRMAHFRTLSCDKFVADPMVQSIHWLHSELITCSGLTCLQISSHTLQQQAMLPLMINASTCMHVTVRACVQIVFVQCLRHAGMRSCCAMERGVMWLCIRPAMQLPVFPGANGTAMHARTSWTWPSQTACAALLWAGLYARYATATHSQLVPAGVIHQLAMGVWWRFA